MEKREQGFTLIELLIVVAIIGIIAAIAIPNLLNAIDRSKQKRTMADMRGVGTACEEYAIDWNFYPNPAQNSLADFTQDFIDSIQGNKYMRVIPKVDGWNKPLQYATEAGGTGYTIRSAGKLGAFDSIGAYQGATSDFECDIIFMGGQFITFPQGMQVE